MIPNIVKPSQHFSSIFPVILTKNIWHSFLSVNILSDLAPSLRFMVHAMAVSAAYPNAISFNLSQMSFSEKSSFYISNPSLFSNNSCFIKNLKFLAQVLNKS